MRLNIYHLESDSDLDQLNLLLETEVSESQPSEVENKVAEIILRKDRESLPAYGQRVDRFLDFILFIQDTKEIDDRIKELQALKKSRTNLAKRLMDLIKHRLTLQRVTKLDTPRHKLTVAKVGGIQPVEIDYEVEHDLDLIPSKYIQTITTKRLDKDKIREDLNSGMKLSWARLVERGTSLRIK
jgi:hypothetical protein